MNLPYLTADLPGIGGALRASPEDFVVDEELPYAASGTGDHVFVRIEKRGLTTPRAVGLVARALGVRDRDVGVAGMKDRHAVTRQWLSLPPPVTPEQALALDVPDVRVLEAIRHNHKLRTGHVRANHFVLRVTGLSPGMERDGATPARQEDAAVEARAQAILARLAEAPGAPNYYGEQRFGRERDNAARGRALVLGEQRFGRDRRLDRLMISALQSELFNAWLVARITDGLYRGVLAGDVLHKLGGGMFECSDPTVDEPRLRAGELIATGPMFGDKMRRPPDGTPAAAREDAILAAADLSRDAFARVRALAEGTRRDAAVPLQGARARAVDASTLEVAFALPGGAYATTVMREVMKNDVGPAEAVDDAPEPV